MRTRECRRVAALLWDYAAQRLDDRETKAVERHVAACAACRRQIERQGRIAGLVETYRMESLPIRPLDWKAVDRRLESQAPYPIRQSNRAPAFALAWGGAALAAVAIAGLWLTAYLRSAHLPTTRIASRPHESAERLGADQPALREKANEKRIPRHAPPISTHTSNHDGQDERPNEKQAMPSPRDTQTARSMGPGKPGSIPDGVYLDGRDTNRIAHWAARDLGTEAPAYLRAPSLPRFKDDFVAMPPPPLERADMTPEQQKQIAAARDAYQKEAEKVDERLFKKVTIEEKGVALEDLCALLEKQTGVKIAASRGVMDEKATIFVEAMPARDVLRAIAKLFGYYWSRSGSEGSYAYELTQDLRSRLAEEELRTRGLNEALLALDEKMRERAKAEEKTKNERGSRWGQTQLYLRLSSADRVALRNGQPLLFSSDSADPARKLPEDLRKPILDAYAPYKLGPKGEYVNGDGPGTLISEIPGSVAKVKLQVGHIEQGELTLQEATGFLHKLPSGETTGMGGEGGWGNPLATARAPEVEQPNNADANRALRDLPLFKRTVSLHPQTSCPKLKEGVSEETQGRRRTIEEQMEAAQDPPMPHVNSADVWEEIHKQTGLPVVADYYTRLYAVPPVTIPKATLFDALNKTCDSMGIRWKKEANFLLGRSASFYWDKVKEVPNRLLVKWQQDRQRGSLPFDDLCEMASLSDAQLDSLYVAQGIRHCWGISEWGLVKSDTGGWREFYSLRRNVLRFLAGASPEIRRRIQQPEGLAFNDLQPDKQRDAMRAMQEIFGPTMVAGSRIKLEYAPPGRYVWHPRGGLIHDGGSEGKMPLCQGDTPDQALAAAVKIDPGAASIDIHPTQGVLAVTVITGSGENAYHWSFGKPMATR